MPDAATQHQQQLNMQWFIIRLLYPNIYWIDTKCVENIL